MRTQRDVHQQRILEILAAVPSGEMSAGDVLAALEDKYGHLLNETDRQQHSDGNQYWQTRARRTSGYMVEDGLLTRPRRGVWKLTDGGWAVSGVADAAAGKAGLAGGRGDDVSASLSAAANTVGVMPLDLQVDDIVTRQQLNAAYGGGIQGGMLTPAGGRYIFLFSDPVPGGQYGYTWDGWADENLETFFYTGEGSVGDQEFTRRNRILRDAAAEGREVHLFVADGYSGASRERTHRYMGQFTVNPDQPWRREDAPDVNGATRSAIVFRLNRLATSPAPQTHTDSYTPELAGRSGAEVVGPEASNAVEFSRAAQEESVAVRRERSLEDTFHRHLKAAGGQPGRLQITIAGQANPLYTDTWDAAGRELYEAKGSVSRNDVRLAIGQLLDYRRHITPPPARCTVLLPSDPGEDLTNLIHSSGMDLLYQDGNTFTRRPATPERAAALDSNGAGLDETRLEEARKTARLMAASFPTPAGSQPMGRQHPSPTASPTALPVRGPGHAAGRGQERD